MKTIVLGSSKPLLWSIAAIGFVCGGGCSKDDAADAINEVETAANDTAQSVAEGAGRAVEEGERMAGELTAKAKQYVDPLKEKLGDLDSLKDTPEELKKAVAGLIDSIEQRTGEIKLPEGVTSALATIKEKLIALRDYLEGEVDQAKIEEHLKEIEEASKGILGMSQE